MSTPSPSADRNLIFGLLALQMDFLTSEQLLDALHAWMRRKTTPIGEILGERGLLSDRRLELLQGMVEEHVAQHGGDAQASLAALRMEESVRGDLSRIEDEQVQASLASLPPAPSSGAAGATGSGASADSVAGPGTAAPTAAAFVHCRFRRLREHAKGGLGEVFVAQDEQLDREVALKEIQDRFADHPDARARFLREAEVTGKLEHPGVVPVYGLGIYPDAVLRALIRKGSPAWCRSMDWASTPTADPIMPCASSVASRCRKRFSVSTRRTPTRAGMRASAAWRCASCWGGS